MDEHLASVMMLDAGAGDKDGTAIRGVPDRACVELQIVPAAHDSR